jgi:hypothetical protein
MLQLDSMRNAVESVVVDSACEPDLQVGEERRAEPRRGVVPFLCGHDIASLEVLQPLPSQVSYIWEVFVERVDPFIKILHVPTTARAIRESHGMSPKQSKHTNIL